MGLNKVTEGTNMYQGSITHTWNTVRGICPHGCTYCYMRRFKDLPKLHFAEKELKTKLGENNFIFVGSSCDMFAKSIDESWIYKTISHASKYNNKYLFQTKNPQNINRVLTPNSEICITLETNRHYPEIMRNSPTPINRYENIMQISKPIYITIEPIMDFDLKEFLSMIQTIKPKVIHIGADSGNNRLPEPPVDKTKELIIELRKTTEVRIKSNLKNISPHYSKDYVKNGECYLKTQ